MVVHYILIEIFQLQQQALSSSTSWRPSWRPWFFGSSQQYLTYNKGLQTSSRKQINGDSTKYGFLPKSTWEKNCLATKFTKTPLSIHFGWLIISNSWWEDAYRREDARSCNNIPPITWRPKSEEQVTTLLLIILWLGSQNSLL